MDEPIDNVPSGEAHSPARAARTRGRLVLVLVVLLSLAFLYRSPYSASGLEVVPDSVEYAVAARRLVTLGQLNITINGTVYPSRYPPWFSLLALAPIYLLTRGDDGVAILSVLLFAIAGIMAAFAIGRRLGGLWAGVGAAVCLMAFKEYHAIARLVLTDIPCASLGLVACAVYLRMLAEPAPRDYWVVGTICAVCFGFRQDMVALCLPFALLAWRCRETRGGNLARLLIPMFMVEVGTLVYNQYAFGDWRRNGYHFWCADPYDYWWLVWSPAYLKKNLVNLFAKQSILIMVLGIVGAGLLYRQRRRELGPILLFLGLAAGPPGLAHLFYFSPGLRFFLLGLSLLAVLGGAGLVTLIPVVIRDRTYVLPGLLAAGLLFTPSIQRTLWIAPVDRIAADRIARSTPGNAVVVSGVNPVYLDWRIGRGTRRTVVPVSRGVGFANLLIVRRRIAHPSPPPVLYEPRSPGLYRGGGRDAVPFTADEAPDRLLAWARAGRPIYLDRTHAGPAYPDTRTRQIFRIVPVPHEPDLFRMLPVR